MQRVSIFLHLHGNYNCYSHQLGFLHWWTSMEKWKEPYGPGPNPRPSWPSHLWQHTQPKPRLGSSHSRIHGFEPSRLNPAHGFQLGLDPSCHGLGPTHAPRDPNLSSLSDRPIKQSAKQLMFSRAIGFAPPNGSYWRLLRKIASSHLFAPNRIIAHEPGRQLDCAAMLIAISQEQCPHGAVVLRKHLQLASLNSIMGIVFGKNYDPMHESDARELQEIVKEGFELLGAFNWSNHLPWLKYFSDSYRIFLVPQVKTLVKQIIEEHQSGKPSKISDDSNFVDILLCLEGEEKFQEDDMVDFLWVILVPQVKTLVKQIIEEHQSGKPSKISDDSNFVDILLCLEGEEKFQEDDMVDFLWEVAHPVDLTELLKLSCEMKSPLVAVAITRTEK
ncbi:unnamed protein product [Ilex paraguariensis]|uniref:Cytochrome P450 n=1 Tax=Ilex paraguariensis TaxID=185542 RepID=A0ABC8SAG1_9AQUA